MTVFKLSDLCCFNYGDAVFKTSAIAATLSANMPFNHCFFKGGKRFSFSADNLVEIMSKYLKESNSPLDICFRTSQEIEMLWSKKSQTALLNLYQRRTKVILQRWLFHIVSNLNFELFSSLRGSCNYWTNRDR